MGLVQDFADAFNRRDVDALLACFTAEASYVDGFYGRHAGAAALRAARAAVPAEALRWRPAPGEWSAHEIVCHCADSETSAYARIRLLLTEPEPPIHGYDQDAWARTLDYHAHPLAPAP